MIYTIYLREMLNNLLSECMRVCWFVWGFINMWIKRERQKGLGSIFKVCSKEEPYDYIGID